MQQLRVQEWIKKRRGILTAIALACDCCQQFVNQVAYGTSTAIPGRSDTTKMVERKLRENGWPGVGRL